MKPYMDVPHESTVVATNEKVPTLQDSVIIIEKKQELKPPAERPGKQDYTVNGLKGFLKDVSITYSSDYERMAETIQCESGWQTDVWSSNFSSYGVAQFTRPTFDENCKGSYNNPYDQLTCMAKIWTKLKGRWDCYWITKKPD